MTTHKKDSRTFTSSIISLLLHATIIGLVISSLTVPSCIQQGDSQQQVRKEPEEIIKAKAVAQSEIDAIYEHKAELKRQAEEAARKEAERKAAEEAARKEAERKVAEEIARKEVERKVAEEVARKEVERKAAEKVARKEAERKAAEEAARKEAERKAAEEAARKEAERKAAEEAARIEAERKAAEDAARKEAERKQHQKQLAVWTREYIGLIRNSIEKKWTKPPKSINGGDCVVRLVQNENGSISQVTVLQCEGDLFYKRSVEDAVWKASPLPNPPSREVFDNTIEIIFKQEY